ncbi:MAG: cysteine--tRNA ligase, partial [Pseudomonadota bacterium]
APLLNDLNTPLAVMNLTRTLRDKPLGKHDEDMQFRIARLCWVLGLLQQPFEEWQKLSAVADLVQIISDEEIEQQIEARRYARGLGSYAEADRIRGELKALGVELLDKPGGETEWRRV